MGRVRSGIAIVVLLQLSACGAIKRCGYAGPGRDDWQQPDAVVEALELAPGMHVADVGAGGGYFTFRLADAVGSDGRVYAVDVDPDMTSYLTERAADEGRENVEVVLAPFDDPTLPESGVDLVFVSNTYHHIENRVDYFGRVARGLRPGGRVAIVEYDGRGGGFFAKLSGGSHATPPDTIRGEMEAAGFSLDAAPDFLERQSFQVFRRAR